MITLEQFVQAVREIAEDSDYSRYPTLQDTTDGDIAAAAVVLWRETGQDIEKVGTSELIAVMMRKYGVFMDLYTVGDDGDDHRDHPGDRPRRHRHQAHGRLLPVERQCRAVR